MFNVCLVRLTGTGRPNHGQLEILVDDQWGTVCDDNWTETNTYVVCRQLGSQYRGSMTSGSQYAFSDMPIHMDEVNVRARTHDHGMKKQIVGRWLWDMGEMLTGIPM